MALILDGTTGVPVTTVTGTLPVANGGSGVTTKTGTGAVVLGTSPTLTTPILGTPTSGALDNCTGTNLAKAWLNYNSVTSTILASNNISSVTNSGSGVIVVNFTNALSDANYAVAFGCTCDDASSAVVNWFGVSSTNGTVTTKTTTQISLRAKFQNGGVGAGPVLSVVFFR